MRHSQRRGDAGQGCVLRDRLHLVQRLCKRGNTAACGGDVNSSPGAVADRDEDEDEDHDTLLTDDLQRKESAAGSSSILMSPQLLNFRSPHGAATPTPSHAHTQDPPSYRTSASDHLPSSATTSKPSSSDRQNMQQQSSTVFIHSSQDSAGAGTLAGRLAHLLRYCLAD